MNLIYKQCCVIAATALFVCLSALPASAITAVRTTQPITLDGKLDEGDWLRAPMLGDWVENMPNEKAPARVKTQVRVLFDASALYIGIRAEDPNPEQIVAPFVRRDKVFGNQDNVLVWIDPTGAGKFAQFFRVNARGVLADGSWNEDSLEEDFSPDYDYEAMTTIDATGWSAEFRIPWASLRLPQPTPAQLRIIAFRNMPRETRIRMSTAPLGREPSCFLCVAEPLTGFGQLPALSGLDVTPYASVTSTHMRSAGERANETKFNAGADIKWRPNADWVVDATFRPDFSQLELDTPQLKSNTRFALYVQEKRPFFLEGTDLYQFPTNAVYTRAITDPLWGTRATYRSAGLDVTALTVADRGGGYVIIPGTYASGAKEQGRSQATFARVRVPFAIAAGGGSVGALVSDRSYDDGTRNTVVATDATFKPNDDSRLRAQVMGSHTQDGGRSDGHALFVDGFVDDGKRHLRAWYQEVSPQFRADNALQAQNGFRNVQMESWVCIKREGFIHQWCPNLHARSQTAWDGTPLNRWVTPSLWITGNRNLEWSLQPRYINYTRANEGGRWHHIPSFYTSVEAIPAPWMPNLYFEMELGRGVDVLSDTLARLRAVGMTVNTRVHERVELETRFNGFQLHDRDSGQLRTSEAVAQLVAIGYVNARDTLRMIAQHTLSKRNPEAYVIAVTPRVQTQAISLVASRKWGLGRELNIGVTVSEEQATTAPKVRTLEAFVKMAWMFNL